jgi:hypothetical protein
MSGQILKTHKISKTFSLTVMVIILLATFVSLVNIPNVQAVAKTLTISQSGSLYVVDYDGYSNSNCSTVFEHVNGLLNTGDTLRLTSGTYTANGSSLALSDIRNVTILFESGVSATITDNADCAVLKISDSEFVNIFNATIDGNGYGQSGEPNWSSHGIEILACNYTRLITPNITNCATYGYICYAWSGVNLYNGVENGTFSLCQQNAITLGAQWDAGNIGSYAIGNTVTDSADVGITAYGVGYNISDNYVHDLWMANNTAAHWGIASEGGNYGAITRNRIENCGSAINVEQDPNAERQYIGLLIEDNNITNCAPYGIVYNGEGYSVINRNSIVFQKMTYLASNAYAGIMIGAHSSTSNVTNVIAFNNTVLVTNSSQALMQSAIWVVSGNGQKTNNSLSYNTVTTPLDALNCGIQIQTNCSNTKIEHNTIQAYNSIRIEDLSCNNTRLYSNDVANCNVSTVNNGTNTNTYTDDTLQSFNLFSDDFSAESLDVGWTRLSSWGDEFPKLVNETYETCHYNDRVYWANGSSWATLNSNVSIFVPTLPASGVIAQMYRFDNVGTQTPVNIVLNNTGGTCQFGLQYFDGTSSITMWDDTVPPVVDTWYNFTVLATKGSTISYAINGVTKGTASNLTDNSNFTTVQLQTLTSDLSDFVTFFDNVQIWTTTGTAGNPALNSILTVNCPSYFGSITPVNGTYIKGLTENQTITLSPDAGATAFLIVDGVSVELIENSYTFNVSSSDHGVWAYFKPLTLIYTASLPTSSPSPSPSSSPTVPPIVPSVGPSETPFVVPSDESTVLPSTPVFGVDWFSANFVVVGVVVAVAVFVVVTLLLAKKH